MSTLPTCYITVFSDYICPFCYVGHHRLMRLQDQFELRINWCFLEIHPETDEQGEPVSSLDYSSETWDKLMKNLYQVARQESIELPEIRFTTNSKHALQLAESARAAGRERFYRLHEALFDAYFIQQKNIADRAFLSTLAHSCEIPDELVQQAWQNPDIEKRLQQNFQLAHRYHVEGVPGFLFGDKLLSGVVSERTLREAAEELATKPPTEQVAYLQSS